MSPREPAPAERFRVLYLAHAEAVSRYAVRRCADPADAADLTAETFLVAWRRLHQVPPGREALLWLYGVARRTLANQQRASRRRDRLTARLGVEEIVRDAGPFGSSDAALVDPAESVTALLAVRAALSRLRPDDAELLRLTAWEGLAPQEIAEVMDLPARTVRTRLARARARLRTELVAEGLDAALDSTGRRRPAPPSRRFGDDPTGLGHEVIEPLSRLTTKETP